MCSAALRAIAIDFETANEQRCSPCALGLAWVEGGEVVKQVRRLIRPLEMRFEYHNVRTHKINEQDVLDAPEFPDVVGEYIDEISSSMILSHGAAFDISVLGSTLAAYSMRIPEIKILCTKKLSERIWPEIGKFDLKTVGHYLGVNFDHHRPDEDAQACGCIAISASRLGSCPISELSSRFSIQVERLDAKQYRPKGVSASSPASRGQGLTFLFRGSKGTPYEIRVLLSPKGLVIQCKCAAGVNRRRCRHVIALLDGVIDDLLSENLSDVLTLSLLAERYGISSPSGLV